MTDTDGMDGLAAEYALGTLSAAERAATEARRLREPALDAAIANWERRLSPLLNSIAEAAPPPGLYTRIEARIGGATGNVVDLTRRLKRWRTAALAASAVAASLIAVIGAREFSPRAPTPNLVAVLQKDAASPAFLITVNVDDRVMTVAPVSARHEQDKSFELWIIHDTLGPPKSLGTIDDAQPMVRPQLASYQRDVIQSATYAVTLEPQGGAPLGQPTGPVVFSGRLLPMQR